MRQRTAINNIEQHSADITCYRGYLLSIISNDYGEENMHSQCCGWMFCLPAAPHFMRLHISCGSRRKKKGREGRALGRAGGRFFAGKASLFSPLSRLSPPQSRLVYMSRYTWHHPPRYAATNTTYTVGLTRIASSSDVLRN